MLQFDLLFAPLIAFSSMAIAAIVLINNRKDSSGRTFALLSTSIGLWILTAFLSDLALFKNYSLLLNRIVTGEVAIFIGSFSYLLYVFPIQSKRRNIVIWPIVIITTLLSLVSIFSNGIVKTITYETWGTSLVYGNWYWLYAVMMSLILVLGLVRIIYILWKLDHDTKVKMIPLFTGLGVFLLANIIIYTIVRPLVGSSDQYYRLANYSSLVFIVFAAYGIIKYRLFHVKLIISQIAISIIVIAIFVQVFAHPTVIYIVINSIILIGVIAGGSLLIRSIKLEIERDELIRKANRQLKREKEALAEIDAMKTEFISIASHELLTPVAAIKGFLSMTLTPKMVKLTDPKAKEYVTNAFDASNRVANLVNDLLNVSRIEQNRIVIQKKVININDLIESIVDEFQFRVQEAHARLVFKPSASIKSPEVYADEAKIKEVVGNLISNAIKYSPPKPVITVTTFSMSSDIIKQRSEIGSESDLHKEGSLINTVNTSASNIIGDHQLVISVKDNGLGLTTAEKKKLFQKFSRILNEDRANITGTGLGLYICKALAELHYGRIWAESAGHHKGSTFILTLPYAKHESEIVELDNARQSKAQVK